VVRLLSFQKVPITPRSKLWQARAHIVLGIIQKDQEGDYLLSSDCVTPKDVADEADALIKELEAIKRQAAKVAWDNHPSRSQRSTPTS
jgi:hypothetical protein